LVIIERIELFGRKLSEVHGGDRRCVLGGGDSGS